MRLGGWPVGKCFIQRHLLSSCMYILIVLCLRILHICSPRIIALNHDDCTAAFANSYLFILQDAQRSKPLLSEPHRTLNPIGAVNFPMALGFFEKPRVSVRSTSTQISSIQRMDHDPLQWAREYKKAVAAKTFMSVASEVTVSAQTKTSSKDKPVSCVPMRRHYLCTHYRVSRSLLRLTAMLLMANSSAPSAALGDGHARRVEYGGRPKRV
ncbi:uncharacterized protein LAESUDRAFT_304514 [Laetiporus sulphureus 93-53]|uniref:Uncharacterized protein n=1 Tax=Laetiporus sulphureus 93-53 TaxID=1314785 RepID=A0A165D8B6_9APHY|nr:uncharacterized protein LAESUDRAFT_304514 [Laetiporus sulphureus 93-53]KZT04318.1 hypothetical protein LAESUDRAFT_304514 [Laetiporus sulphureus 93-53]